MASGDSFSDESWPKWKLALAVGTPVALGLAGVWLYRCRISSSAVVKSEGLVVDDAQASQAQVGLSL